MKVKIEKANPEPEVTATLTLTMTRREWREWNARVQRVDGTCPLRPLMGDIDRFVRENCHE